jgi:hypothetical protein
LKDENKNDLARLCDKQKFFGRKFMALQLTLSSDLDKSQSGPTLIHSTGVQHYKIPPEVVGEKKRSFSD